MPLWVTLVVGLGAGVVGTLLSTSVRIRHERESELRLRMLDAAISFAGTANEAVDALRLVKARRVLAAVVRTKAVATSQPIPRPTQGIDVDAAHNIVDALIPLEASVRVLFGPDSQTASAAHDVWKRLFDDMETEEAAIEGELADTTGTEIMVEDSPELRERIDEFARAARRDLRGWAVR